MSKPSPKKALPEALSKSDLGFTENKAIPIIRVKGIDIQKFRSLDGQQVLLGSRITVLSGRNGTMKTSLMGLIAHPFSSSGKDALGQPLKTTLSDVFNLSKTYDLEDYNYDLVSETSPNTFIKLPVEIYYTAASTNRHRVVVSGSEKGDGNPTYNSSFLNLKRLFPIVDLASQRKKVTLPKLSNEELVQLKTLYENVFPSSSYGDFVGVHRPKIKSSWAPSGGSLGYDWQAISSGEDNIGSIFNRLVGFQRAYKTGQTTGGGILCIDEFEASLHPVAQIRLFEYLLAWSAKYKVQIVLTTHSIGLISDIYLKHAELLDKEQVIVNFVSKSKARNSNYPILHNPPFEVAYKELTFSNPIEVAQSRRLKIFCEDDIAIHFLKKIIGKREILSALDFHSSLDYASTKPGISYTEIKPLQDACRRFPILFESSLVVLDPDVPDKFMTNIKLKDFCLRLPDSHSMAIERRIIFYIVSLENDDYFFEHCSKERDAFLSEFSSAGISLTLSDIADANKTNISLCKKWANSSLSDFKTYVNYYVKHELKKEEFISSFIETINLLNGRMGLPPIQIQSRR